MKNRFHILFVLVALLSTCTAASTYAQRIHGGGNRGGITRVPPPHGGWQGPRGGGGYYYHGYRGPVYHGGFYYSRPWYRPRYNYNPFFPPIGVYVSALPFGYFTLGAAFGPVYYYGGTYYESTNSNRGYKVVDPPLNATVPDLPDGAQEVSYNGNTYYEVNGTYYQELMTDNGRRYKVIGKNGKIGDQAIAPANNNNDVNNGFSADNLISQLPDGCRSVSINGVSYFLSPDGMYYQEVKSGNTTGYKIVGKMNADQ
ncbi:DUF6515 family protein [Chitinophaga nivalis]|uniref:DUF6515 family protein n=1 Tax=Chitinophaga nivalis TaxID=2991709 RepID=A0ABT3IET1_9BACT|nr:DUF6515 family protein [Chitinophaga nivalis]MCW3468020.1 DUF6515 family protein [Chitinophaga nivalis]MCW3482289.1 DUF6515 family protein [Chitinophaga nivalis]